MLIYYVLSSKPHRGFAVHTSTVKQSCCYQLSSHSAVSPGMLCFEELIQISVSPASKQTLTFFKSQDLLRSVFMACVRCDLWFSLGTRAAFPPTAERRICTGVRLSHFCGPAVRSKTYKMSSIGDGQPKYQRWNRMVFGFEPFWARCT